ncbi:hypothetical protein BHE74_00053428 [Ensete ventricosum]|nr:hypothetical protein BHE74_00053428 [Ensete ventricosum]
MCVGDRSCFSGKSADELGEQLFPSLGNDEERSCCGFQSVVGQKILLQFLRELVEGKIGCRTKMAVPHPSRAKGDICLEFSPALSFDLVTSFCTSSSLLFTCRSCTWTESVESDDKVSGSRVVCSSPRYEAVEFSRTIKGVSDRVLGGFYSARLGQAGTECSRDPLGWSGAAGAPTDGEPLQYLSGVNVDCPTSGHFCWSARHVCSVMSPAACCHGDCSLAVGLPIDPPRLGRALDVAEPQYSRGGGMVFFASF